MCSSRMSSRWDVWMLRRGRKRRVLVSVAHIWKREEFLPPEPNPPCAVQPMCNDGSSSWKCRNKNWNSCRWTYERCWESGIQFNPLPIIPVSQKHFPTFNAGELAKGNLLHLKSHGLCTQPRKWEGVLVLVVVPQIGRPHHVLAPHPLLGGNATQRTRRRICITSFPPPALELLPIYIRLMMTITTVMVVMVTVVTKCTDLI